MYRALCVFCVTHHHGSFAVTFFSVLGSSTENQPVGQSVALVARQKEKGHVACGRLRRRLAKQNPPKEGKGLCGTRFRFLRSRRRRGR